MKNLLFGLIATVLFSVTGSANNQSKGFNSENKISIVKEQSQEVRVEYSYGSTKVVSAKSFTSQKDIQKFIDSQLEEMAVKLQSLNAAEELTCSATVRVGTANNYIEVTVSGPCSEIAAAVKKLKKELLAAL
jgi:hypothetical protein